MSTLAGVQPWSCLTEFAWHSRGQDNQGSLTCIHILRVWVKQVPQSMFTYITVPVSLSVWAYEHIDMGAIWPGPSWILWRYSHKQWKFRDPFYVQNWGQYQETWWKTQRKKDGCHLLGSASLKGFGPLVKPSMVPLEQGEDSEWLRGNHWLPWLH